MGTRPIWLRPSYGAVDGRFAFRASDVPIAARSPPTATHGQKKWAGTMAGPFIPMRHASIVAPFTRSLFDNIIRRSRIIHCAKHRTDDEKPPAIVIREFRHDRMRDDFAKGVVA